MPSPGSSVPERGAAARVGLAVGGLVLVFGAAFGVGATIGPDRSAEGRPSVPAHPGPAHPDPARPEPNHPDPVQPGTGVPDAAHSGPSHSPEATP